MGGGRKVGEAKAHQLPVEAIYELAARPNVPHAPSPLPDLSFCSPALLRTALPE